MSELNSFIVRYNGKFIRVYEESDADKVIAELEESHKKEVGQLLMAIVELKKEKEYVIEHTAEVINGQEQEIRHSKYKRCLAMALLALEKRETYRAEYEEWCLKWYKRWLAIAEKFKPNSTAQQGKEEVK